MTSACAMDGHAAQDGQHVDEYAQLIACAFCEFYGVAYPINAPTIDPVAVQKVIPAIRALYSIASP